MSDVPETPPPELTPRVRRILEAIYAIEGVATARVWVWSGKVAVGVRGTATVASDELLRRVTVAALSLRELDETWEFGLLDDE